MKTYTIIGGVNGTGKSSLTGVLRKTVKNLGKTIDVDKINAESGGDVIKGGKLAIKTIDECIEKGVCFAQETTLSGHKTAKTAQRAIENGYFVRLYYIGLSTVEESLKRIDNRVLKGGHNIPSADVIKRFDSRFEDIAAVLPYCNEAVFYDNENGFEVVAEYLNGELTVLKPAPPDWIKKLKSIIN